MSNLPLISICLPVFNGEKFLALSIESALAQTFSNFELLIADDLSTDSSRSIIESYASRDPRIRFLSNKERLGLFGNYNETIRQARGSYIKTYAQDDLLEPQALEKMLAVFKEQPGIALVSSARRVIDEQGKEILLRKPFPKSMRIPASEVITFNLINLNNWVGEPSTVMFTKEYSGTGFDTGYYHYGDIEYWFRILKNGDYYFLDDTLSSFRRHQESQTDKNHKQLFYALDILRLSLQYKEYLQDIESKKVFRRRISETVALHLQHLSQKVDSELSETYEQEFLNVGNEATLKAEAAGFRLLASYALSGMTDLIAELDHEKRCRFDEHERFVSEVDKMQNSIYWKLTNPFRMAMNAVKGSNNVK